MSISGERRNLGLWDDEEEAEKAHAQAKGAGKRTKATENVRPHSGRCPVCTAEAQGSTRSTSVQIVDYR
jgi:hypothetical protein